FLPARAVLNRLSPKSCDTPFHLGWTGRLKRAPKVKRGPEGAWPSASGHPNCSGVVAIKQPGAGWANWSHANELTMPKPLPRFRWHQKCNLHCRPVFAIFSFSFVSRLLSLLIAAPLMEPNIDRLSRTSGCMSPAAECWLQILGKFLRRFGFIIASLS